jgi:prepilin-type N-terminal cleavage/methylation domain-containing protein
MPRRNRRGFTLLEAVIALAIIGAAVVGVLGAFGGDVRAADRSRTALTVSTLARSRLARLEIATATELATLPDSLAHGAFDAPFAGYQWKATSRAVPGEPDLYDLRVTVSWNDGQSELRSRRYRPVPLVAGR